MKDAFVQKVGTQTPGICCSQQRLRRGRQVRQGFRVLQQEAQAGAAG